MYIGALIHVHFGVQHLKLRLNLTLNTQVICHNCKHRKNPFNKDRPEKNLNVSIREFFVNC